MLGLAGGVIGELGPSANGVVGSSTKRIYEEGLQSSFNNAFPKSLNLTSPVFQSYLYQRLTPLSIIDNFFLGGIRNAGTSWTQEWLAK